MTSVSWKNNADGNWSTGANWSTGFVPGVNDDVTISVANAHTITHSSGSDTVATLSTNSLATLALTGGTLAVSGYATLYGNVTQSAGSFLFGPSSYIGGSYVQSAGKLTASSGTLRLDGVGDSFAGTLAGSMIDFESGTDLLAAGMVLSAAAVEVTGATVSLGQNLTYGGAFAINSGTIALGAETLALSGQVALSGGATTGTGGVTTSGHTTIGSFYLTGGNVLTNTGTAVLQSYLYVGYYAPDTAQLHNQASGTLRLYADTSIYGVVGGTITNAGTLVKAGGSGTSNINVGFSSTGTVSIATGTLAFNSPAASFAGTISGAGAIALNAGTDTLASGITLTAGAVVLGGAAVALGGNLAYAGDWSQTSGTLTLNNHTLSQTGTVALAGGYVAGAGTMTLAGVTEFAGTYLTGSVAVVNNGIGRQNATFYDGPSAADTTSLINSAGATYDITGSFGLYGAAAATFSNAGTLIKSGGSGTAVIGVSTTSTGSVLIDQGTLRLSGPVDTLGGTITGAGRLEANSGADKINVISLTVGHVLLDGAAVTLGAALKYTGDFGLTAGTLALGTHGLSLTTGSLEGGIITGTGTVSIFKSGLLAGVVLEGDATLSNGGSLSLGSTSYIGYNASDAAALINKAGATLSIVGSAAIGGNAGSSITNAGTIVKSSGSGTAVINDSLASTGVVTVNAGTLRFAGGTNSFAGSIGGAGTLELSAGADTLASGISLTAGAVLLDGTNLTLGGAISFAGQFAQSYGTLALGGHKLALSGPATFEGGAINGTGTITSSGAVTAASLLLEGNTSFINSGTLTDTANLYDGIAASDTTLLANAASGTIRLLGGSQVSGAGTAAFTNAGTLLKTGSGNATIGASLSNTGSINIAQGALVLSGTLDTLAGAITGAGTLDLSSGAVALNTGTLTASSIQIDSAAVTLGAAMTLAGVFTQNGGSLALEAHTLALTGRDSFYGGIATGSGTLATSGNTELYSYTLEGSTALSNSGILTITDVLGVGYNSSDTAAFTNLAGGHVELIGSGRVDTGGTSSFTNAGSLLADGTGQKYIRPATTNTGRIEVSQGTLSFLGTVAGTGTMTVDSGASLTFSAAVTGAGTISLAQNGVLALSTTAGFSDVIAGFSTGDLISLAGFSYDSSARPTLAFNTTTDQLTVTEDSTHFVLTFSGSHTAADFTAINNQGVIGITHT